MIILLILITSSHDNVWISLGENCCWSLLGLKGLMGLLLVGLILKLGLLSVSIFCSFKLLVPFFYNQLWLTFTWIPAVISLHFLRRGNLNRAWYSQTCQTSWPITFTFWAVYSQLLILLFHYVKIISSFKLFFNLIPPFTPSPGASKSDLLYER